MSNNQITFALGTRGLLTPLFPFTPSTMQLTDCIGLCLNQTLERDGFDGAWASVWANGKNPQPTDLVHVSIVSPDPNADVTGYQTLFLSWLKAAQAGLTIYTTNDNPKPTNISFLSPFGLAMLNTKSVQLLHYPPTETLGSMDYLYSPTNRRWETLLAYNGCTSPANKLLETITDIIPVAAPGGKEGGIEVTAFANDFAPYDMQMLNVLVRPVGQTTLPVVAYGGPVMAFVGTQFPGAKDLSTLPNHPSSSPAPLSLYQLQILTSGPTTPVLCANHPSLFMYEPTADVLMQDLVAAGWQVAMANDPTGDPVGVLAALWGRWTDPSQQASVQAILAAQTAEFSS